MFNGMIIKKVEYFFSKSLVIVPRWTSNYIFFGLEPFLVLFWPFFYLSGKTLFSRSSRKMILEAKIMNISEDNNFQEPSIEKNGSWNNWKRGWHPPPLPPPTEITMVCNKRICGLTR